MEIIKKSHNQDPHPSIPDLKSDLRNGKITRREFLWNSTMLGLSAAAAYAFTGIALPKSAAAADIQRGGTLTCGMDLQLINHPARLSWNEGANVVRQVAEYLTDTGSDNITRPWLCEKWVASEDLKTWDLHLRKGVKFNNGDMFGADDVMYTIGEWLNPDVGSSMLGLLSYLGGMQNVEKVNDHQVRLHLNAANIGVPEHLFHYPGVMLHRNFQGDFIKQPIGTGPFTLEEFSDGQRAVFKRRADYWKMGADRKPLPYIDKLVYVSMPTATGMAATRAGQLDSFNNPRPSDFLAMKKFKGVKVRGVMTAQTFVIRMRVDLEPWNDNRVRTALKMCMDRKKILQLAGMGEGELAIDAHMAPIHPAYCVKPIPEYDPQGARKLLEEYAKEKGIGLPLRVSLATKNDESEDDMAVAMKELMKPAGFDMKLDITEPGGYWDRWTEVDLGITSWTHRPLATMVLALAYTKEAIGAWNETRWYDDEFAKLLREAERTLDVEKRRAIMCKMEDIMQERGPISITYWKRVWNITNKKFHNIKPHPASFHVFPRECWKEA